MIPHLVSTRRVATVLGCLGALSSLLLFSQLIPARSVLLRHTEAAGAQQFQSDPQIDFTIFNRPLVVTPVVHGVMPVSTRDYNWVVRQFQPPVGDARLNSSYCLHVLRVHGLDEPLESTEVSDGHALLKLLTDEDRSRRYFGESAVITTRTGVRFPTARRRAPRLSSMEMHRDQTLAALAELHVPLDYAVHVGGRDYTLADVLTDSLANFDPNQDELAWTLVAYSLYLPGVTQWRDRYGQVHSMDELVSLLQATPFDRASCEGTHILYALTILLRADDQRPILPQGSRATLMGWMRHFVGLAVARQRIDGSWGSKWWQAADTPAGNGPIPTDRSSLQPLATTSHVLEWLIYLPESMRPSDEVFQRGAFWLLGRLRSASRRDMNQDFCPYAHTCCVLRHLLSQSPNGDLHEVGLRDRR
jgi:hypothetical protein